ncbi:4-(cytidine 5'-diphospho)-2-C-methyl-D-erythritol kinase [Streptococcus sp. DD10]|uniref:4-(cytidine 5'-diphospho)-2-C-methyl-D-erythritol kinase n=1 Tax=Streptococcus sp. DD10 TaxID=1777878 RepID=UPI0008304D82|nr:4-(cytidine 5'-diphospho)-2-C-methyl-D-erythritol kinase [Streptococcus sp. DD10]
MNEIVEKAPAKINLGLDVVARREDGFHELAMVMVNVDLSDYITVTARKDNQIVLECLAGKIPLNGKNHVYKAVQALRQHAKIQFGVSIKIEKNIPVSAGMAGGSSDAAATLRALNQLWKLDYSLEKLAEIGLEVGSDVPYCIYGGTAYVSGRGEQVEGITPAPKRWLVIVKPHLGVSTGTIFKEVDIATVRHVNVAGIRQAIEDGNYEEMLTHMGNSLEDITIARRPEIQKIKTCLRKAGADIALMSGSGPSVFALCKSEKVANRVLNSAKGFCKEVYKVRML